MTYRLLNLACGSKVSPHGDWTNVDFDSPVKGVVRTNILSGLDFPDATFDAVYTAQFIEHLTLAQASAVLREVGRVMKPGAVLRLVTPDLEELSRSYLNLLDRLKVSPDTDTDKRYDWIRIELFDQIERDRSGGETLPYLASCDASTQAYIVSRLGHTGTTFFSAPKTGASKLSAGIFLRKLVRLPSKVGRKLIDGIATDAARVGRFRRSGEVHRYIHDIYSLSRLLHEAGFPVVERADALHSRIPDWRKYELDEVNGIVDAPLSLYVEALRA